MEWNDLAAWIAVAITLGLSILVPLFTQIANNRHQRKIQKEKIQFEQSQKRIDAYESFLLSVGGCVISSEASAYEWVNRAGSDLHRMYLYSPEEWWADLDELADCMEKEQWNKAKQIMQKLSHLISSALQQ